MKKVDDTPTADQAAAAGQPDYAADIKQLMREVASLRKAADESSATNQQLLEVSSENQELKDQLRSLTLEMRALRAQTMTSDEMIRNANEVLLRLEAERQRYGNNAWLIQNHYYKNRSGDPVSHRFYSNAETPAEAVADFKRRTGVQFDATDKRGDPFKAVRLEPDSAPA